MTQQKIQPRWVDVEGSTFDLLGAIVVAAPATNQSLYYTLCRVWLLLTWNAEGYLKRVQRLSARDAMTWRKLVHRRSLQYQEWGDNVVDKRSAVPLLNTLQILRRSHYA